MSRDRKDDNFKETLVKGALFLIISAGMIFSGQWDKNADRIRDEFADSLRNSNNPDVKEFTEHSNSYIAKYIRETNIAEMKEKENLKNKSIKNESYDDKEYRIDPAKVVIYQQIVKETSSK